jgi:hypothetical protein
MPMIQRRAAWPAAVGAALACCALLGFSPLATAQYREDPARVVLAAPLHEAARRDAQVIGNLPAGESVTVLQMSGAYSRVRSAVGEGWVLSSRLHIGDQTSSSSGDGGSSWLRGLSGLLGASGGSQGSGGSVPVGIRGLQREDIANAQPNPAAMAQLERYVVSVAEAEAQALAAGLQPVEVAYLDDSESGAPLEQQSGADQ